MSLNNPTLPGGKHQAQYGKHEIKAGVAVKPEMGVNEFSGEPEALLMFNPGTLRGHAGQAGIRPGDIELTGDIMLHPTEYKPGDEVPTDAFWYNRKLYVVAGLRMLCPICGMSLLIQGRVNPKGNDTGSGRQIIVHWDKMTQSTVDGKYRPLVTVDGSPSVCDYLNKEIGLGQEHGVCGFRFSIEMGRIYRNDGRIVVV